MLLNDYIVKNEITFKELLNILYKHDLLLDNYELKENILKDTGVNIIHKYVDEFNLEMYRNTCSNMRYEDFVSRGLSYSDNKFFNQCLEILKRLEMEKKLDDLLESFINNNYLDGCYINGILIQCSRKTL